MQSLAQFKAENNVQTIDLMQGKGRMFATVNNKPVIVAKECDMSKPLYVFHNEEKGLHVICNSGAKVVASI